MEARSLCDFKNKVKLHGNSFSEELQYYLKKFKMTQRELSLRINVSTKYLNQILNNEFQDLSASLIEAIEYAFDLDAGTLIQIYNIYSTNTEIENNNSDFIKTSKRYGVDFLIQNPNLAKVANINVSEHMSNTCKMIMLKKFYGVKNLSDYDSYLKEHIMAEYGIYSDNPHSLVWIRYCELSLARFIEHDEEGAFRINFFEIVMKKIMTIISNKKMSFYKKVDTVKDYLFKKGIVLITKPHIKDCNIRAISLKKRGTRYIFLSDMYNAEPLIFFALLHEIVHCFHPEKLEKEIDAILKEILQSWTIEKNKKLAIVMDAIDAHEQAHLFRDVDPKADISAILDVIYSKYPRVSFTDTELLKLEKEGINE
ncbi:helix-turn-helix domain-containing protein [Metamycoplasma spumans]|uniref:helix-turn-helix domain-containing protein n=1 Tax=Metamycoplasma spumans TaxID=92406 RepID=UPI000684406C